MRERSTEQHVLPETHVGPECTQLTSSNRGRCRRGSVGFRKPDKTENGETNRWAIRGTHGPAQIEDDAGDDPVASCLRTTVCGGDEESSARLWRRVPRDLACTRIRSQTTPRNVRDPRSSCFDRRAGGRVRGSGYC